MEYTDEDGCWHETYQDYVTNLIGLCGCRDDAIAEDVCTALEAFHGTVWYTDLGIEGPDKYVELLLHVLDSAGLIEHGSSVRGSWLTDKGRVVAEQLAKERLST